MQIAVNDRILVVAPHPDDESIGVGGLLALYNEQCDVLILTDGRHSCDDSTIVEEELIAVRKKEIREAAKIAGINNLFFLNVEDRHLYQNKNIIYRFDIRNYRFILVPNRYETHIDHQIVFSIFNKMVKKQKSRARIYEYEIWTALRAPTDYIDISAVIDKKKKMIECHKSQLSDCNYVEKGIALSCYRGMYSHYSYAEALTESSRMIREEVKQKMPLRLLQLIRKVKRSEKRKLYKN